MLDIKFIRENPEKVKQGLKNKGVDVDIDELLKTDESRRKKIREVDEMRARQNILSDEISKSTDSEERGRKTAESKEVKAKLIEAEEAMKVAEVEFDEFLRQLPNIPLADVPVGPDESGNVVLREVGVKIKFSFKPRDYVEIGEKLDLIDTKRAAKVSGTRFGYLKREASLLEFALVQFALQFVGDEKNIADIIMKRSLAIAPTPFIPVVPPVLIKPEAMKAMGYVERGGDEIYFLANDNLYLVGTSEQSVGPMYMGEVFAEEKLPHRHIAFSTCFRREAGSYGKDTRGILRVHQFDKAEMFVFSTPETSEDEHELLLGIEEALMAKLGIPYHVLNICTGDLGDPAASKYDIEAWLPGQNGGKGEYRETHSTSNTTDFQARRLNIKVRRKDGKLEFLHMLNGTGFAIGRTLIAILENYQQEDGSVGVPEALQSFMGGIKEIRR
ncbi:MAG: serine--tRNA ligase [Candidatus Sungbacteria bacterium RIFCSPLOWO2_01_FULL_47_32]|uniref:Serine--tRNA ligase n=1 Tax=Candidatus Sungbacteria bacterium RIFCSPHIGHO2_01_FULL_47_32 TaxID=1802264 RepID=A0A1G2K5P6_9BACT|nr:MAG: Serine-tRNA ligase [Parcubacteria group bacterium GW2011_GWA2_47_10]OGZ93901.1 MAG: serine--tRNA ligase [Candidatus Sungbacteria bacterium RIFCSPHIGHO2_01_FULL_47_32]OGZ99153.1 MAG: serine--tRNA ligase [Candidatus Sungbacteria bacterium RIFCSPHIGHO2_02_FULL_46_12]OHA06029.1 MAG: serine--tRNA ligase [Candidatus Sungbacteria bacterium RIFCSPLOWO2_01_FULL_47_32]